MMSRYRGAVCIFGKYTQNNLPLMLSPINHPTDSSQQVRNIKKHWNPKFRKERREKVIKVDLPNYDNSDDGFSKEEVRSRLKKLGLVPQREWSERPILLCCTPTVFESYVVPEGDGKFSTITKEGAKQRFEFLQKKSKSYLAIRKVKSYDENFAIRLFEQEALDIYLKAHNALAAKDDDTLIQCVTESLFPQMIHNVKDKTIHWRFVESLEPARTVHARVTNLISKQNLFAQITIRFHTQQILCIYDRFGRVMQGSETLKKDVLDYIVFEKHLSNTYGTWRMHGKIVPSWMPPEEVAAKTYQLPKEQAEPSPNTAMESVAETVPPQTLDQQDTKATPSELR